MTNENKFTEEELGKLMESITKKMKRTGREIVMYPAPNISIDFEKLYFESILDEATEMKKTTTKRKR